MQEEVDGVEKLIQRGYTMLAIAIVKDYMDECRRLKRQPKHLGEILKGCGLEDLATRISVRSMSR